MTVARPNSDVTIADVRTSITAAREHGGRFFEQIVWQVQHQAWTLLDYDSWDAMREAEYGDMGVVVPSADRPEIASRLYSEGLSQREIATTLGVGLGTVNGDVRKFRSELIDEQPATRVDTLGRTRPTSYAKPEPAVSVAAAVEKYPDLAEYPPERAVALANALDGYDEDERVARLDSLAKHTAAKKRGDLKPAPVPDTTGAEFFDLVNRAARLIEGKQGRITDANVDTVERDLWVAQFRRFAATCTTLADRLESPQLRRVK